MSSEDPPHVQQHHVDSHVLKHEHTAPHHHQILLAQHSPGEPQHGTHLHQDAHHHHQHHMVKPDGIDWNAALNSQHSDAPPDANDHHHHHSARSSPHHHQPQHQPQHATLNADDSETVQQPEGAVGVHHHHHHHHHPHHQMAHEYGPPILEISNAAGSADSQQAAAAVMYGHVQMHHPNNPGAHYMSATSRPSIASYGPQSVGNPTDMRGSSASYNINSHDLMSPQKAVAFLAGPRERIHVFGNPVDCCPRCQQEGFGNVPWRPHRHIGELKIRYICERNFEELESNHHFDIPLCPVCGQVLYLYEFNGMLGVSSARRLHKYVLKCATQHVLPIIDLFCQTKRCGERCNSNFKLQWSYGTMVKRCESQKNRDHDLWWVRYKNEWKQRRTIIRYKKDFLRHLSDVQRALLLGLGLEGESPPDPKNALGPTYDALVANAGGSPAGPKIKKRQTERNCGSEEYDYVNDIKRQQRDSLDMQGQPGPYLTSHHPSGGPQQDGVTSSPTTSGLFPSYVSW
eukprot:CAMPEP_0113845268 /NCGR_PEP_ID=MMETSP0372-20130328/662_1 /TAXON_ID=340204 /ORGANISM="Lankesteria abbotti" /LENGTH=513 /DNA_ID=CAMNT_0000814291 /DNA_START=136 /DNA_END=1674 /DNA_ORIENTATION=+ /assembly_acc=CAM_ASM_000359